MTLTTSIGWMMVRNLLGAFAVMASTVILARELSVADNGIYASLSLLPVLISTLASIGVAPSTVFHIGVRKFDLECIVFCNYVITLLSSTLAVVMICITIFYTDLISLSGDHKIWLLLLAVGTVFPMMLFANVSAILQGLQQFKAFGIFTVIPPSIFFLCVAGISLLDNMMLSLDAAVVALFLVYWATVAVLIFHTRRLLKFQQNLVTYYISCVRSMLKFGFKAHIGNAIGILNYRLSYYIILSNLGAENLAQFAIAATVCEALWILSTSAAAVIFPAVANQQNTVEQLPVPTLQTARWVFYLTCVAAFIVVLFAEPTIALILKSKYNLVSSLVFILMPGILCLAYARVLANDIAGRGAPMTNTWIAAVCLIVNCAANYVLIPHLGLQGAAIAACVSYILMALLTVIAYANLAAVSFKQILCPRLADFQLVRKLLSSVIAVVKS